MFYNHPRIIFFGRSLRWPPFHYLVKHFMATLSQSHAFVIIAYIFHDFTQKIAGYISSFCLWCLWLNFIVCCLFRLVLSGSAHCIIYANLNFALDGTRGTLPLPFSQFLGIFVLWNTWSLLILWQTAAPLSFATMFYLQCDPMPSHHCSLPS